MWLEIKRLVEFSLGFRKCIKASVMATVSNYDRPGEIPDKDYRTLWIKKYIKILTIV